MTDTLWNTYTILTTDANEQMSQIHNSKKRMPMILTPEEESIWLQNGKISVERNIELKATPV
jgi:putative SOS response-associated peptidase YedK